MKLKTVLFCFFIITVFTAYSSIIIVGELTHETVSQTGTSYSGEIVIENVGNISQEVKIYQTDYSFYSDGRIIYGDPGEIPRSNANWITFSPKRVNIEAGGSAKVFYTVNIPDNSALTGTYWSIFMVEEIPPDSPESGSGTENDVGLGIRQAFRYGIQIVTHIGDTGTRMLNITDVKLQKENGNRILQLDVENTGERWLRALLWTELYDGEGILVGKYEAGKLRIYPETSVRFNVDLSVVPNNKYTALVIIDCGGDDIFGATYSLSLQE
jgi:hypothetical protein